MAGLLAGALALSVDSVKNKRRERRERRQAELERSLSEAGPSTHATMAIGEDEELEDSEAARAKAREAYEEQQLNNNGRRASTDSLPENRRHSLPADDLPPPYADAPPYAEHKNDTLLSSTPRRRRHSRRASEGQREGQRDGQHAFDRRAGKSVWHRQPEANPTPQAVQQQRPRSPPREGETEEQRRKRKEKEFWNLKGGAFWGLVGVSLARGIATM